jgi:hypothetical protein
MNELNLPCPVGEVSDGYHTFNELYDHRIILFIALCKMCNNAYDESGVGVWRPWRSKTHSDGSSYDGWFILGLFVGEGDQITYHLPLSKWGMCDFAETLDMAPIWDGHTPEDVLRRIEKLIID